MIFITNPHQSTMSFHSRIIALRDNAETSRVGLKWTDEENAELLKQVNERMDITEIGNKHHRTVWGIKSHLMSTALDIIKKEELTLEEAACRVNIPISELETYKQTQEKKT